MIVVRLPASPDRKRGPRPHRGECPTDHPEIRIDLSYVVEQRSLDQRRIVSNPGADIESVPLVLMALGKEEQREARRKSRVDRCLLCRGEGCSGQETEESTDEVQDHVEPSGLATCRTHT